MRFSSLEPEVAQLQPRTRRGLPYRLGWLLLHLTPLPPARRRTGRGTLCTVTARLLLALALVLAQVSALVHVIEHVGASPMQPHGADDDKGDADRLGHCAKCLALSGIDIPLADSSRPARAVCAVSGKPALRAVAEIPTGALPPRCRAPPALA